MTAEGYGDDLGINTPTAAPEVELGDNVPDSWSIDDVKEVKALMEPATNVLFTIKEAKIQNEKDGAERTWKWIDLTLVCDGYLIADEMKYKNKHVFQRICYYANHAHYQAKEAAKEIPSKFPYDKQISASQHILDLKAIINAACPTIKAQIKGNFEGIDDESANMVAAAIKDQVVTANVTQSKDGSENVLRYYKKVKTEDLV
ncbi:hypothetical protein ACFL3D_01900 [Candidatus Omnitrophota bacterium]